MIPGEIITAPSEIELNAGRERISLNVANSATAPFEWAPTTISTSQLATFNSIGEEVRT